MSQLVIRESSDSQNTSEDQELSDQVHDEINQVNKMMHSGNQVDKRLIELFKVRQADQKGIRMSKNDLWGDQERVGEDESVSGLDPAWALEKRDQF